MKASSPSGKASSPSAPRLARTRRVLAGWIGGWDGLGRQTQFYWLTLRGVWDAIVRYNVELVRLMAQMSLGIGALAIIGGTLVIVGFLTLSAGSWIAVQAYNQLADVGVEALAGFTSAFLNVRITSPVVAGIGLAATVGAGTTAQLGAMRINEEIDALEVMGIRSIAYLASTRVLAGVIVVIPLYCIAVQVAFIASRVGTTFFYGQSTGVYDHYFNTFLNPVDLIWSFLQAISMAIVVMLVHTYYGFTASGGPAGVGEAVGRAVRASLVVAAFVTLLVSLAIYGESGNFNLSG